MKNQSAEHRLHFMRAVQQARYPIDYGDSENSRCATCLHIEETPTTYLITTHIYGIEPESLSVSFSNSHLIIEGKLLKAPDRRLGMGRYARLLEVTQPIDPDYTEVTYHADGTLQVRVWKQRLKEQV